MSNMLHGSTFFCMAISLFGYEAGIFLRKKLKIGIFNPLLVSIVFVIIVLKVTGIDYDTYDKGANVLSYLLTPSTVCLAIPLYQQMNLLKKNLKAIIAGITTGVFVSLAGVWVFSMLFHLKKQFYVTLLPKSITTAIGMGISEELGGIVTITVAAIVITGILEICLQRESVSSAKLSIRLQKDWQSEQLPMLWERQRQWKWEKSKVP